MVWVDKGPELLRIRISQFPLDKVEPVLSPKVLAIHVKERHSRCSTVHSFVVANPHRRLKHLFSEREIVKQKVNQAKKPS